MMKKLSLIFILAILLIGCSKENFLRLPGSEIIRDFIPNYEQPKRFRSNQGDTISMRLISYQQWLETVDNMEPTGGSLPDYDKVEAERIVQVMGSDDPFLRFTFDLRSRYNASLPQQSEDVLNISFEEAIGKAEAEIEFLYTDTLQCISDRCVYVDSTLKLQYRTFSEFYFTRRDSVSRNSIYLSAESGLLGFRTSDNKIYELIQ